MTIGSELAKYIGNEMIKTGGKELAKAGTTSALSSIVPGMAGKIGSELSTKSGMSVANSALSNLIPTKATKSPDIDKYLGGRLLDDSGKPMTFYHSTPNDFSKFDDSMLGKNTGYSNTSLGHFVTNDKDFSKRFIDIDNVGKTGRTMELQAKISNPITHPYMAGKKYGDIELDNIVKGYLEATDNQDLLDELMSYADENGSSLYDEYMDMTFGGDDPFEFSGDERELLKNKGYDAVEIVEGTKNELVDGSKSNDIVSSYAVLDGNNLRPVRHIPVQQDNHIPLYHQTSANSLDDFSLDKRSAGVSDATMPEGIFLKETDADIGLPGKNQLQLDARLNNPLKVMNREDLKAKLMSMNPKVAKYLRTETDLDNYYEKLSEEAQNAVDKAYEKMYYDRSDANKKAFAEATEKMKGIIPEWRQKIKENAEVSQKQIKKLLKDNGYDGMIMDEDRGSFGRKVKSYLVLDKEQLRDNNVPVKFNKNKTNMDDDLSMLMSNDESNLINKMNGNDTTADELVVKNILNKHGISDKTFSLLKGYSDLGNSSSYEKYKSALSKLLESGNEEVKKLNKISRDIIMSMGIEFEDNMPVVYRAVPHNSTGDGMSYTLDKKIAEKLVKNDGDTYKSVIRYVIKPDDIVIAPQILGPIDNGGDLRHIIVKKIKNS